MKLALALVFALGVLAVLWAMLARQLTKNGGDAGAERLGRGDGGRPR